MRKTTLCLLMLFLLSISGCKVLKLKNPETQTDMLIDGDDAEWEGNKTYFSDNDIVLGMQHDEDYQYLLLISRDKQLERQMLVNGFTIWLNNEGKRKKTLGLKYQVKMDKSQLNGTDQRSRGQRQKNDFGEIKDKIFSMKPEFLFLVDKKGDEKAYSWNELSGFDYVRKEGKRWMVNEMRIPLSKDGNEIFAISASGDKPVLLGIECNAPDDGKLHTGMGSQMSGGMSGGMGGGRMSGGRMGGGRMSDGSMPERDSCEDYMIWIRGL